METLFNSFIIQLILSGILFIFTAYLIIRNSRLKKEIETLSSKEENQGSK